MSTPSSALHHAGRLFALAMLFLLASTARAQSADPPTRAGALTHVEGSVAHAPAGETEWSEAVRNRPLTRGDRLWTDEGARAELHAGGAALHLDSRTFVDVAVLDGDALEVDLREGSVRARVRQLHPGESFEIATPHLVLRAEAAGDFRIDVDPAQGFTRVTVHAGTALLQGAAAGALQLHAGQQLAFAGRELQAVAVPAPLHDAFDRWAAERHRLEDQSVAARYVPRDVVGYAALDAHGSWAHDATYGAVWFPRVAIADWAPYRYGRWEWIAPWGWTWVDDAPWGFAPFHYGRWAEIGSRWAWVPGPLGPRPAYAPALVTFVGGTDFTSAIAWYPLAPGEAWQPFFHASPVYIRLVNRYVVPDRRWHEWHRRTGAVTSLRHEDFHRGRAVHQHWRRVHPSELPRTRPVTPPAPPEGRRWGSERRDRPVPLRIHPPVQNAAPAVTPREWRPERRDERRWQERDRSQQQQPPMQRQQDAQERWQQELGRQQQERAQREQAQREQAQREALQRQQQQQQPQQQQPQQQQPQHQQPRAQEPRPPGREMPRRHAEPGSRLEPGLTPPVAPPMRVPPPTQGEPRGQERRDDRGERGAGQERRGNGEGEGRGRGRGPQGN